MVGLNNLQLKKEADLRSSYTAERGQAMSQGIAETGLTDLNQAIETDRQNLNLYMQRANELKITNPDRLSGNVSTVEEARVPRGLEVFFQAENGLIGMEPLPEPGLVDE